MKTLRPLFLAACFLAAFAPLPLRAEVPVPRAVSPQTAADYFRLATEAGARKDWDAAKSNLRLGLQLAPRNLKALTDLAWVLNEQKQYDEAILVCRDTLQIDDDTAAAWRELGYALLKKEEYELSAMALVIAGALDHSDRNALSYFNQATAGLERQGKVALANQYRAKRNQLVGAGGGQ